MHKINLDLHLHVNIHVNVHLQCLSVYIHHSEGDKLVTSVQKNMSELAVGLLHLQQNIAIPEITLPIHPLITAAVETAFKQDRKPVAEDLGDHLSDATFLNALQKQVATWTREIRKVSVRVQYTQQLCIIINSSLACTCM